MTQVINRVALRSRSRGLSMVEILVSLVIGLVISGAVLVSYLASNKTGREQAAYAEMNENAQLAFSFIGRDLLLAGYSQPKGVQTISGVDSFVRNFSGRSVFGCDKGFVVPGSTADVVCNPSTAVGLPSIEVSYEADLTNTVPTATGGKPSDCLGNGLTATDATTGNPVVDTSYRAPPDYYVTYNRYYLATGATGRSELHCASKEGNSEPIVDNVEGMKIWYGIANLADPKTIVRYVSADPAPDWTLVVSVKVCLLMRSSEKVLNAGETGNTATDNLLVSYLDCDSATQTSSDRYLRRAYFSTTTLRNKMAL
jgi:type IV pilus assembly protein PilW